MSERLIVSTLQPVERWQEFKELPIHMTFMPWFSIDQQKSQELSRYLRTIGNKLPPLQIIGGEEDGFGASGTVPVRRVAGELIRRTHFDILAALSWVDADYDSPYVASEFNPHVTNQNGSKMLKGEVKTLTGMQVFERISRGNICKVIETFDFKGENGKS